MLKSLHLCQECKRQDGRTLNGYVFCWECAERRKLVERERRAAKSDELNRHESERRAMLKEQHLCIYCERRLPDGDTRVLCARCRGRKRLYNQRTYVPKRVGNVCYYCCSRPPMDGYKVCKECYTEHVGYLEKAWEKNRRKKMEGTNGTDRIRGQEEDRGSD